MSFILQLLGVLSALVIIFAPVVFTIIALVSALKRKDLKNNRFLWLLLIVCLPFFGMVAYFFVENRKRYAYYAIICELVPALIIGMYLAMR